MLAKYYGRNMFRLSRIIVKILKIRAKYHLNLGKGSQWFSITGDFAHWLVERRKEILRELSHTWCPDEIMIQSFVNVSPYRSALSTLGNLRAINWERGTPYVWQEDDYDELVNSGAIFGRKFNFSETPLLLSRLLNRISL